LNAEAFNDDLPAGSMVVPFTKRIMRRERRLDGNRNLSILHELPSQIFSSIYDLTLATFVHEHAKLVAN
jgi:hypothetical protein